MGYERVGSDMSGNEKIQQQQNMAQENSMDGMTMGQNNGNMNRRIGMSRNSLQSVGNSKMGKNANILEEVYCILDERTNMALCFHEQLADYFCFLGLQGFKRMCEYQYMKECAGKRKLHKRYIDMHHKILPTDVDVYAGDKPDIIPKDWSRYTTHDINDSVIPRFVRMALKAYYEWEKETKEVYSEQCEVLIKANEYADYEFLKELILDVEKEIKKIMHLYESLNGTGYDVNAIHAAQDKYHEKYKRKYEEHFTKKHNATGRTVNADNPSRAVKRP